MKFTLIRLANDAGWFIEYTQDYGISQLATAHTFSNGEVSAVLTQLTDLLTKAESRHATAENQETKTQP